MTLFILALSGVFSCSTKLDKLDYLQIEKSEINSEVDFCNSLKMDWDSIVVIMPYSRTSTWKSLDIENINSISGELSTMTSIDWKHYLIIIKSKAAVAYIDMPYSHMNFECEDPKQLYGVITKNNCVLKYEDNKVLITML